MKEYLGHKYDRDDPGLIQVQDELPFWSAHFGIKLLETMKMKKGINALDIGSGYGFPLIEAAQRLGKSCRVYGIDPWKAAADRIRSKIKQLNLSNIEIIEGYAEELPFENDFFDLIISNNGINNVKNMQKVFDECYRVGRKGAQFVFTLNCEDTMWEFYSALEKILNELKLENAVVKMKEHIYTRRKPLCEITEKLHAAGFISDSMICESFKYRFTDAETMFNYAAIKYWFLPAWKEIVPEGNLEDVFERVEKELNKRVRETGLLELTVPFAVFAAVK